MLFLGSGRDRALAQAEAPDNPSGRDHGRVLADRPSRVQAVPPDEQHHGRDGGAEERERQKAVAGGSSHAGSFHSILGVETPGGKSPPAREGKTLTRFVQIIGKAPGRWRTPDPAWRPCEAKLRLPSPSFPLPALRRGRVPEQADHSPPRPLPSETKRPRGQGPRGLGTLILEALELAPPLPDPHPLLRRQIQRLSRLDVERLVPGVGVAHGVRTELRRRVRIREHLAAQSR